MPYTAQIDRPIYDGGIQLLAEAFAAVGAGDGDLNYVLTKVALAWLMYHKPPYNYALRSDVMKAFTCAGFEWYERVMKPYEQQKKYLNGDVYPEEVL